MRWCFLSAGLALAVSMAFASGRPLPRQVDFNRDIRPILSENCFHCHGADANQRKAKLRLDIPEAAAAGTAIVPGRPEESELIKRVLASDPDDLMPPPDSNRRLDDRQKALLRAWIQQGAHYDTHWAFKTPQRPVLPPVKRKTWVRNPIDVFTLARLESEKLKPAPEASPERLLRRVSLDLTGLPPAPEQLQRWLGRKSGYEEAVDELLSSPRFGERMAVDWMDVARYADTHGFNNDSARTMWRWRDWVIDAFNRNLSYDRFITEQLAGDLLPDPTLEQVIATGFNRNHVINSEGGIIDEEYRVEYVADRVRTTSLAWLGLTMECARCHDHKYDPITQKDFYRLFAFFNNVEEYGEDGRMANAAPMIPSPTREQQEAMARHRAAMQAAEERLQRLLSGTETGDAPEPARPAAVESEKPAAGTAALVLDVSGWDSSAKVITNAIANAKPFRVAGKLTVTHGPLELPALVFGGTENLRTDALPGFDSGKGWAFQAWVRRDSADEAALFWTMDYHLPESSQEHGRGAEIRLKASGAIEVRMARRWPAYSVNLVTRETLRQGEWHHVIVTCDGSTWAKGFRVFIDGEECFRDIRHDDLLGSVGISGDAALGTTREKNAAGFRGALADVQLFSKPFDPDQLAAASRRALARFADERRGGGPLPERLRRRLAEQSNPSFSKAADEWRSARAALLAIERDAPTTMVMREMSKPRPAHVLFRGEYDKPREAVEPGVPDFILPFPENAPRNRLGLAQWFTDRRHPLTARVVVNRFWESLFGTGIVKTSEDFGFQADWPSHPELLDWLAVEFIESGWDVKHLLRLIVTSATYRQDSRSAPELNERDPENRLLARGPRQRLTAEMLRDQALWVSGLLQERIGGPPVFPYQPPDLYKGIIVAANYPGTSYTESQGPDLHRRSLYTFWKRTVPHPTLATFDAPDREVCVARRLKTNTPLQALALMNDPVQLEAARKLAERALLAGRETTVTAAGKRTQAACSSGRALCPAGCDAGCIRGDADRLRLAFVLATCRKPEAAEERLLLGLLAKRLQFYRSHPDAAQALLKVGSAKPDPALDAAELAAWANVTSLILNLDETITRN